jgi:YidC/Oxa1 family membrane protein insertase
MEFYFGSNKFSQLKNQGNDLEQQVKMGWGPLKWINRYLVLPIFNFFETFNISYGIIILLLTLILKTVLFPFTYKSYLSMAKMRVLKPEMDEIKKRVGEGNQALVQQEYLKLYKQAGVNPLGGCLPLVFQMPFILAFFYFFPNLFELRHESFLWMTDLSTYDELITFPTIPLLGWNHISLMCFLMTISTLIYTYFNNQVSGVQGQMKYIGYITPIIFFGVLNSYPAGLNYYYFCANVLTFAQQYFIRKFVDDDKIHAQIQENKKLELKMLHFFINTGINDNAYYWNELVKCIKVYVSLKKECPTLDSLNIGGGFPIKNSLAFEFDYQYMIDEIINQIKIACDEAEVDVPNIFTEFGSFTVGESGGAIYKILYQKQQNDREKWNMIDSSFITTLPDTWAINKRFIMLPINRWNETYERVLLGGMTCDSDDYYNSEQNMNAIYLPKYNKEKPLYIGFFNTGAYQETIGGYGGLHHCLIPEPKQILIDRDENGILATEVFSEQQTAEQVLQILGYNKE